MDVICGLGAPTDAVIERRSLGVEVEAGLVLDDVEARESGRSCLHVLQNFAHSLLTSDGEVHVVHVIDPLKMGTHRPEG